MKILAIETSCDETAAAVVEDGTNILSNVVASSSAMHEKYGGIVPEVAAREQFTCIIPVITEALSVLTGTEKSASGQHLQGVALNTSIWQSVDAIAVTVGPGLIGSLLVGVETAKTIAFVAGKPIIPVNHVLAHTFANFIGDKKIEFPAISLVASGGHTELYVMKSVKELKWLGGTLDDAAGECFDKTARLIGLGTGGGMAIEEAAKKCKVQSAKCKVKLPRPMLDKTLNFSFSGLKTAVLREFQKADDLKKIAFAYEIQEAITDVLVKKTLRAAEQYRAKSILLSGGVAANSRLREKFSILPFDLAQGKHSPFSIHVPPPALCTDNAVAIASYAYFRGVPTDWHEVTAISDLSVEY